MMNSMPCIFEMFTEAFVLLFLQRYFTEFKLDDHGIVGIEIFKMK